MPMGRGFWALVGVAGGDVAGDFRALFEVAADDDVGGWRAGPVALLEAAIAAVETCHHLIVAVAARRFGVNQGLRLVAPFRAFIVVADAAQEMQRAKDFREPLQIRIVGSGLILCRWNGWTPRLGR